MTHELLPLPYPHPIRVTTSPSNPDIPIAREMNDHGFVVEISIDQEFKPGNYNATLIFPDEESMEKYIEIRLADPIRKAMQNIYVTAEDMGNIAAEYFQNK